jgi:arylsulfatase A-like enzyme
VLHAAQQRRLQCRVAPPERRRAISLIGWERLREETLARQKQLGVVPPDTKLASKPPAIKDWEALFADEKRLFAREMEVFAGFGEYADHEIGRLIEAIRNLGQLDNTLVFYIVGDSGASAEGGMNGVFNARAAAVGRAAPGHLGDQRQVQSLRCRLGGGGRSRTTR